MKLQTKWNENSDAYKTKEIGSGVHSFIKDVLKELLRLEETPVRKNKAYSFVHDTQATENGRPDFVVFVNPDIEIPIEAKCYTRIDEGVHQLFRYQLDYGKQYGILTDGFEWRFYRASTYRKLTLNEIFANPDDFLIFWQEYTKVENYYKEVLQPERVTALNLNDNESRSIFFDDTTKLISKFRAKMKAIGVFSDTENEKIAVETSYSYLIQFILYKVLVDNRYTKFEQEYKTLLKRIQKAIQDEDFYNIIINEIRTISEYISEYIYRPFEKEQKTINKKLKETLHGKEKITIDDIAPWLDVIVYINKYDFSNLKNEIFGFVYENYLKDLYQDKDKGQYFTDPDVVNLMLEELGYTDEELKRGNGNISIIDPSCGAGTFLYSAVDKIIEAYDDGSEEKAKQIENLVDKNIFGLDIEEFPLFLAEMSILMRMLPLIVNDKFENPIVEKFKLFKTNDSISEFLGVVKCKREVDLFSHANETEIGYPSFMRDKNDLTAMFQSMRMQMGERLRFDYVIGNPPYIGFNECCKQQVEFTVKIKNKNENISLGNVYGVNLHSIPNKPKGYRPNPNLYAFFVALGFALLKDNAKICYIIPQTLLTAGDLDVLRYYLSHFATIDKIITFEGNLFIGRGLKQNRPVATSSLIFVARNASPTQEHKIKVVHYQPYSDKKGVNIREYLQKGKFDTREIPQSDLRQNIENWNYIKMNDEIIAFERQYKDNSDDISVYYDHKRARSEFGCNFWFDGGYGIDEKLISQTVSDYEYPKLNHQYYSIKNNRGYWSNTREGDGANVIRLRQGNQGYNLLDSSYKIIWSYANPKRFHYTDKPIIWARNQFNAIGGNNKNEILYLFAILNSTTTRTVLTSKLKTENEKSFLLSGTSIKRFVRVPKINSENEFIKNEIIERTSEMIFLENVRLRNILDFSSVTIQKIDCVEVTDCSLVLHSNQKKFELEIPDECIVLIKNTITLNKKISITLQELKNMIIFDAERQHAIKNYVDDLIFALYFNVPLKKIGFQIANKIKTECSKNQNYNII